MSSMARTPMKAGTPKPKVSRPNPAKAINDRDWRRKQMANYNASRASSVAGSPPPSSAGPTTIGKPGSQCPNKKCSAPNVVDGTCQSCGAVVDDSDIVADVQFGEASNGQAIAFGVTVGHDQAGPRMGMGFGNRKVAGGGNGEGRMQSAREAKELLIGLAYRLPLEGKEDLIRSAHLKFVEVQGRGFTKGRSVARVATVCLYWAIRRSRTTTVMLIDIADVVKIDVFHLGRTFKKLLLLLYGDDENCPFEPLVPEDVIRCLASRLEFISESSSRDDTELISNAAVRILQRMDRDWMVLGRKPAGLCGSALIMAARMFNYRRTPLEVSYVAKVTKTTLQLRLDEFARLESAKLPISDFLNNTFLPDSHDPPAFYRQTREYKEEIQKKMEEKQKNKRGGKRKRPAIDAGDEELQPSGKEQRNEPPATDANLQDGAASTEQPPRPRTDDDGFVIPPLPRKPQGQVSTGETHTITEDDISEAMPTDQQDEEDALVSKYGDVPLPDIGVEANEPLAATTRASSLAPGAKTHREKKKMLGSSLKDPVFLEDFDSQWTDLDEKMHQEMIDDLKNTDSSLWAAAAKAAQVSKETLLKELENMRPDAYQADSNLLDAPDVAEDEFADDPEVLNCLLSEDERKIKEQLWLNENKDWLRLQQEKEFKKKMAPPKKARKNNTRKPRIGEGQLTPASSAGEAALETAKRHQLSTKIDYSRLTNMFSRGPGSTIGSEVTSQQTSRVGSVESDGDESDVDGLVEEDDGNFDDDDEGEQ